MGLKVLVLEDDPSKKAKLLNYLSETNDVFERIDTAICTDDAERFLIAQKYDLFVVDIVVPKTLGGEKHEKNSIDLLERIDEGMSRAQSPDHVLPVSSSSQLSARAYDYFIGRPWGILPYDDSDDNALTSIEKISRFILSKHHSVSEIQCDALIVTALMEPEFSAIEALPFSWGPYEPLDKQHLLRRGSFTANSKKVDVVAVFCLRMGPVQAAILTTKCMVALNPKIVLMSGICAGIPTKTEIGDVVAADLSWDWQSGKHIDSNGVEVFQIAPHQLDIHEPLRTPLLLMKKDTNFWKTFAIDALERKLSLPKLVIGPMATGSSVLADERVSARIKLEQHRNVAGLDMETYGVYAAVQACNPQTSVLSLKAVCDKGDMQKNDEHQIYASMVSSRATENFLLRYFQ